MERNWHEVRGENTKGEFAGAAIFGAARTIYLPPTIMRLFYLVDGCFLQQAVH